MRAYEFVLFEYRRDKTETTYGPKIQAKLNQIGQSGITPDKFLEMAEAADPTPNKKYVQWIVIQFTKQGLPFEEIVNGPNGQLYKDIEYFDALTPQQRDADRFKSDIGGYNYETLRADVVKSQNTSEDQFEPEPLKYKHSDQMKIVNKKTRRFGDLIIPESYEASCELGSGTRWCTASRKTSEPFDDHTEQGPLYVWIPSLSKQVERDRSISRKFQFHFQSGQMTDEADRQLKPDEIDYFRTGHPVLSEIFQQQEAVISKNAKYAYKYAKKIIKGRWPEAEPAIAENAEYAFRYAKDVIKGRWPEGEPAIAENAEYAYYYAITVIKGRWPEGEPAIAENAEYAYYYAKDVINGRWPEAEETIAQDAEHAYDYAITVIKDRWPEGEPAINQDAEYAYYYARDVIKD